MSSFIRANRDQAYLKLAITGASGSGKTYSALQLAFGLGGKIALIDTENGSASLYSNVGEYDVMQIGAPFTVKKVLDAIAIAVKENYSVLVVDSVSHFWAGDGGLLAQKEALDSFGGNGFTNWGKISKLHSEMLSALLQSPIHVILTMRTKTAYTLVEEKGKMIPRKHGMAIVQREGIDYEVALLFELGADHTATATKDRTGLFDGYVGVLKPEHGRMITAYLSGSQPDESKVELETTPRLVDVHRIVDKVVDGKEFSYAITRTCVYQLEQLSESDRQLINKSGQVHFDGVDSGRTVSCGEKRLPLLLANRWEIPQEVSNGQR